jgi:hypothetical protein
VASNTDGCAGERRSSVARGREEADARDGLEVVEVEVQDALLAADVKENVDEKENVEEKDCFGRWVRAAPRH